LFVTSFFNLHPFPSLTHFDLAAVKDYYASHIEEIDRMIVSHDEDDILNG
jgi:hypothetical protein